MADSKATMARQLLLVEDDDAVAEVVGEHLVNAGYALTRESDGLRALQRVRDERFDLVLLDLMLPGADGWDICRALRQRSSEPPANAGTSATRHEADVSGHTPIIMLSARCSEAERVLGLELGADDYLPKPFSMLEMVARVRALLRRVDQASRAPSVDSELRLGELCVQPHRRQARLNGHLLPLTLREFDLLYFLARHPGQVFSCGQLLEQLWCDGFDGYEHTVNSHVNRLRRKVAQLPGKPRLIETVWGMGYRLQLRDAVPLQTH